MRAMQTTQRRPDPRPEPKPDPQTVALLVNWLEALPADEVRQHALCGSPAVRAAAREVLASMLGGLDR